MHKRFEFRVIFDTKNISDEWSEDLQKMTFDNAKKDVEEWLEISINPTFTIEFLRGFLEGEVHE